MSSDIVFVSTNDWVPWGGSEVLWSQTAMHIKRKFPKYQISACVKQWQSDPKHVQDLNKEGINIIYKRASSLPLYKRYANRMLPSSRQFRSISFEAIMSQQPASLVIFSLGDHNEACQLISSFRIQKIPYVLIVQLAREGQIANDENYYAIKDNYLQAERIFFVSKQNQRILELQLASKLHNAEVISNPFPQAADVITIEYPNEDLFSLGFVASLSTNHKGHDLLFQVLAQEKWRSRNLQVNLYGKGPHEKFLRDLKQHYNLENVSFGGFSSGISKIWKSNHAAILCSRMEGQSLALLEAMSYNRMPIVTDVGDARELIEDGVNGFIADAPTVKHVDEALERAWSRRAEWKTMGLRAGDTLRALRPKNPVEVLSEKLLALL